jgi:hypothetical protein
MRTFMRTIVITGAVVAAVGVGRTANAQVNEAIKFTTTFPFSAGNTTFPAGAYTVRPLENDHSVMLISNGTNMKLLDVIPTGTAAKQPVKDEVVFRKEPAGYVLSQIWDAADGSGVQTIPSKAEGHTHPHHYAHA